MSAISAASSASPRACRRNTASSACSTRRSAKAASSATAVGMAAYGLKPLIEIQFADYIYPGYDQIVSEAAKMRYRTAGEWTDADGRCARPMAAASSAARRTASRPKALFTHIAGLKTVIPSTPYDAKGLLIAAIEDHGSGHLLRAEAHLQRPVRRPLRPPGHALGQASGERGAGRPLHRAARQGGGRPRRRRADRPRLRHDGPRRARRGEASRASTPRSSTCARFVPLDIETIEKSVKKTGRCLIAARGDPHLRLRRRALRARPGALLLSSRSAGRARDGLRHALSAQPRMGLFPRSDAHDDGA